VSARSGHFLRPLLREPERAFVLQDLDAGVPLATTVETAVDSETRRRGLLGRTVFPDGSALVIAPCPAVHTFFMKMSIDIVFASREGVVLKTCAEVPAWRIALSMTAFATIELPAGTLARTGTVRGHRLSVLPADAADAAPGGRDSP
jgi:uncharacterized membrane protein (UPF0127 family)